MASGSLTRLAYVAQAARNTQPTTPTFTTLRDNKITGTPSRTTLRSEAARADRATLSPRLGQNSAGYSIPVELAYGAYDDLLAKLLCGAWTDDVLKVGTTRNLLMFETFSSEIGGSDGAYQRRLDCEVDGLDLTFASDAIVKGNFSLVTGGQVAVADGAIASSTYGDPSAAVAMTSYDGAISLDGSPLAIVTEMKFSIKNGIKQFYTWNDGIANDSSIGPCMIEGSMTVKWVDDAIETIALSEETTDIVVTMTDPIGNEYEIDFPCVTLTGGWGVEVPGPDILVKGVSFTADYDDTAESPIVITRTDYTPPGP